MQSANTSGKAANLSALAAISGIRVPSFTVVSASADEAEIKSVVSTFLSANPDVTSVAIRSSAPHEDARQASFAGMYESRLNVAPTIDAILAAIAAIRTHAADKHVTASHYAKSRGMEDILPHIDVIVQSMVNAERAGVLLSHSPGAQDGYWLVSSTDGLGDSVANGSVNGGLIRVARGTPLTDITSSWLVQLIEAGMLIERAFGSMHLDIEFAFERGKICILQCRPLSEHVEMPRGDESVRLAYLSELTADIERAYAEDVLGDMIDINPAELLGGKPSTLEVSVFRYLFGDTVVERAREELGYAPLHVGLIRVLGGKPYVSLRSSAFSLRPAGIPDDVYDKLVTVYCRKLNFDSALQNRVEFQVIAMRPGNKLERIMTAGGLDSQEKETVRSAFARIDRGLAGMSYPLLCDLGGWKQAYESVCDSFANMSLADQLRHVRVGTHKFVQVARMAFYWRNVFEEDHPGVRSDRLLHGRLWTRMTDLRSDLRAYHDGQLPRDEVVRRYGHIRPGQFPLFGETYGDNPDYYLLGVPPGSEKPRVPNPYELEDSLRKTARFMEAREDVKYLFARALSLFASALRAELIRLGMDEAAASGHTWDELISGVRPMPKASKNPSVIMPEVLVRGTDLRVVRSSAATPTYVTSVRIAADLCILETPDAHADVAGKIVLIRNADPGFDYLFRAGAAGIITQNGGPASHMCIRAVEMRMPACIGCGQQVYHQLSRARSATLDCDARRLSPH
jgi:phosphohistidine swiveling domain-containing protein